MLLYNVQYIFTLFFYQYVCSVDKYVYIASTFRLIFDVYFSTIDDSDVNLFSDEEDQNGPVYVCQSIIISK